jgi:hypothetical protein
VYVNVHVLVPLQAGSALGTPADTVKVRPQLSVTGGAVGAVVNAGHATVDAPAAGITTVGAEIVYVYTQFTGTPSHPVYVKVQVLVPTHGGSALGTPAAGVTGLPQSSMTVGGVGITARAGHATVDDPGAGSVNADGSTV